VWEREWAAQKALLSDLNADQVNDWKIDEGILLCELVSRADGVLLLILIGKHIHTAKYVAGWSLLDGNVSSYSGQCVAAVAKQTVCKAGCVNDYVLSMPNNVNRML